MPYVNIKITREGATSEQKAALIRGVTELLRDTLGKNPATTVVVIDEVDTDKLGHRRGERDGAEEGREIAAPTLCKVMPPAARGLRAPWTPRPFQGVNLAAGKI